MVMAFSVFLLSSFAQNSSGLQNFGVISELGSFGIAQPGHFSHPQFVAVGDDGSIYVSDLGNKRVQKFSSNGDYITEWGQSGKQPGEFHYPSGIAVSGDFVFVADRELNRIQKFSTDGEFISEWGAKGIYEGQFFFPNGIAVNNGTIYVVDTGNQRIQTFSTDGEFLSSFGSSGLGEGQFLTATGIDIDKNGTVFVTDRGNGKVEKFNANGEFLESLKFDSYEYTFSPEAIAVDPNGEMFVVNAATNRILHLPQDSNLYLNTIEQAGPYPNSFDAITDITIGPNGELFVVDSAKHKIKSFETSFYIAPEIVDSVDVPIVEKAKKDQTKPVVIAPISLEVEAEDMLTSVSYGEATATDDSGIKQIINNAPSAFHPGITNIIWIAFDNAGHSSSAYQTITVKTCGNAYSDYNLIEGTEGDDVIYGTDADDLIFGLAGNDLIFGGNGNDCIFGGYGDDVISGDDGNDTIRGNTGHDILKGNAGTDVIYSDSGSDVIDGGDNNDRCYPSDPNDLLLNCEE